MLILSWSLEEEDLAEKKKIFCGRRRSSIF
jgi:hypothetical protein